MMTFSDLCNRQQASPGATRYPRTHPGGSSGSSSPSSGSRPNSGPRLRPDSGPRLRPDSSPRLRVNAHLAYQRCNSQDSLGELAMDDYWKEVENISCSGGGEGGGGGSRPGEVGGEVHEDDQQKVPEEGELEEAWLAEAGLTRLFDDSLTPDLDQVSIIFTFFLKRTAVVFRVHGDQSPEGGRWNPAWCRCRSLIGRAKPPGTPPTSGTSSDPLKRSTRLPDWRRKKVKTERRMWLLMNFRLLRDKTGQTRIGDLSSLDMKKVRRLVLVEMTALFDTCGIDLKAHKAVKVKAKESGLFGVPLATLLEQDQRRKAGTKVPLILQRLISHIENEGLDTEGLLRIPGSATRVKSVCQDLECGFYEDTFPWQQLKQHDAASLLKKFIRELPHPLLTVKYLNAFISVDSRWSLALVEFFQRVIDRQAQNKMTLNNVSVVMAPNMFIFKGYRSKVTGQQEMSMATSTANIVRQLIRYQGLLWMVPKFILTQVRQQNVEHHQKLTREGAVRKLLKKITVDKPTEKPIHEEGSVDFIRVQAPQFNKVSMAVQLTEELQAADVLTKFLSQER
ncbi:hypothetical protein CRUP_023610 [Coryphaenoides rupestris]|nr:hypothetical protein CRUP_023610 [Coryphaenoides rupestris]